MAYVFFPVKILTTRGMRRDSARVSGLPTRFFFEKKDMGVGLGPSHATFARFLSITAEL